MSYIPMPPRNTTAETLAQAISKYLKLECSKHFPIISIGDTAEITSGGTPDTNNTAFWDGDIVWITPKDLGRPRTIEITDSERKISTIGVSSSSAKLLPIGTILLSSRAPIGHLGISQVPLATNQGFKNIICKHQINNRFLFHMLRGSIPELQSFGRGNTFAEIPSRTVKEYAIPLPPLELQKIIADFLDTFYKRLSGNNIPLPNLPPPLADQQRIVAKIERLAGKIEEAHRLCQHTKNGLERLSASWLNSIFSNLSPNYFYRLSDIAEIIGGGTLPDITLSENENKEVLFVKVSDMNLPGNEVFIWESALGTSRNCPLLKGFRILPPNSIVFPKRGGAIATNKKRILQHPAVLDPNMMGVFSKNEQRLSHQFLFKWFNNLDLASMQNGTSVPQINKSDLAPLALPIPPISEQLQIVKKLDTLQSKIETLKHIQAQTAAELDAMLPSILDKAFKGEL